MVLAFSLPLLILNGSAAIAQNNPGVSGASTAGGTYTPNPRAVSLYNLGLTAHKQGSPESAIIFFKRACDIDPNLADAQYNLGVLYQMQKRYKEAIPRFEEVLRIKPVDPDAHYQLGIILQDTGRPEESRQHFLAIAPNNVHFAEAQRRMGQLNNPGAIQQASDTGNPALQQNQLQAPSASNFQPANIQPYQNPANSYQSTAGLESTPQSAYQGTAAATSIQPYTQAPSQQSQPVQTTSQAPATAYIPPGSAPTPAASGPVPVLSNSTLRVVATGFSAPSGLAFDRNGSLYVANYMTNSIDRIGPDGTRNTFCTGVNLRGPIGLVVDDSNNLYVANYNGGTVVKVSPAGISTVVASGFKKPYYLTLDKDGNLYVSQQEDNSIVRIVLPRALGAKTP